MAIIKMGIDIESEIIVIFTNRDGICLIEPVVALVDQLNNEVIAVGKAGKFKEHMSFTKLVYPMAEEKDRPFMQEMLKGIMNIATHGKRLRKYDVGICFPDSFDIGMKEIIRATVENLGARSIRVMDKVDATAKGIGVDTSSPFSSMIVNIGVRDTNLAVYSNGKKKLATSVNTGVADFDESLDMYLREKQNIYVGKKAVESLRKNIGTVYDRNISTYIRGRNLSTGYPIMCEITAEMIKEAFSDCAKCITDLIKKALDSVGADEQNNLAEEGIILTGEGSMIHGMKDLIKSVTGMQVTRVGNPVTAAAVGCAFIEGKGAI